MKSDPVAVHYWLNKISGMVGGPLRQCSPRPASDPFYSRTHHVRLVYRVGPVIQHHFDDLGRHKLAHRLRELLRSNLLIPELLSDRDILPLTPRDV